jgi:capsular polysaccharide transport system permease protein
MSDAEITYISPTGSDVETTPRRRRTPWAFIVVVVVPTVVTAIYFFTIASPRYVSEARFVIKSQSQNVPSSLGVALQSVGLGLSQNDAFAVHEYLKSRDAVNDLQRRLDLRKILAARAADPLSRYPRPWEGESNEDLYKSFQRFLTVGFDSTNGISTLRVESFTPEDSRKIASVLLDGSEEVVNRLNERSASRAVLDAASRVKVAEKALLDVQGRMTAFRNREALIDPQAAAAESGEIIGSLMAALAQLKAQQAQLQSTAPDSPALPALNAQIAGYEEQVAAERAKLTGSAASLAPQVSAYERLKLDQEISSRALVSARSALDAAEQEASRQQLYLQRIVQPGLPDKSSEPSRFMAVLIALLSTLLCYGGGWLVWAGVREHRQ